MEPLNHALVLLSKLSSGAAGGNTGAEGLRLFGLRPKEDIGLKLLVGFIKFDTLFFLAAGDVDFSKLSLSGEEPLPWVGYAEDRLRTCCGEDGCEDDEECPETTDPDDPPSEPGGVRFWGFCLKKACRSSSV